LALHQQAADELGATTSSGQAKKDGESAGMVLVAIEVALGMG